MKTSVPLRQVTFCALGTAILCALSPFSFAIGPIPLSFATLVIYFLPYLLGRKQSFVCVCAYLLLGAVGVPVFSNFGAGIGKLLGPTGGFLIGYLPLVLIVGYGVCTYTRPVIHAAFMLLGTGVLYAVGMAWFCYSTQSGVLSGLALCVFPFLPGDMLKIWLAVTLAPVVSRRISAAVPQ